MSKEEWNALENLNVSNIGKHLNPTLMTLSREGEGRSLVPRIPLEVEHKADQAEIPASI